MESISANIKILPISSPNYIEIPVINILPSALILIPVLLYPPFIFSDQISASPRITMFLMLIMYLSLRTKRFGAKDMLICTLLTILLSGMLAVNSYSLDGLRTAGNIILTLVFAYALSRAAEMNSRLKSGLVKFYKIFFLIAPISSVISVIYVNVAGELNFFNLYTDRVDYIYTPFGLLLTRGFFGMDVYRSFFFFGEPVYAALFYIANVFLVAPSLKEKSNIFYYANIIGGILTFSFLFLIGVLLFFIANNKALAKKNTLRLFLIAFLVGGALLENVLELGSFGDRAYRMNLFLTAMEDPNIVQVMFGRGFYAYEGERGFSAGIFTTIYEVGIINLVVIMLFTFVLAKNNKLIILLFFLGMLVVEPIKLPFFWVLFVVLSVLLPNAHSLPSKNYHRRSLSLPSKSGEVRA